MNQKTQQMLNKFGLINVNKSRVFFSLILLSFGSITLGEQIIFNMFSDAHISYIKQGLPDGSVNRVASSGTNYNPLESYRDLGITHWKLDEAIRQFNINYPDADFLIELGDLKSGSPLYDFSYQRDSILDACTRMDNWVGSRIYHVVGNHDLQMRTAGQRTHTNGDWDAYISVLQEAGHHFDANGNNVSIESHNGLMDNDMRNRRAYYSWTIGNFHFMVLDNNGGWDDVNDVETSYYNGSRHYKPEPNRIGDPNDWEHMVVGIHREQLDWIASELAANSDKGIIFFSHHCLNYNKWRGSEPNEDVNNFFIRNHPAFHNTILSSDVDPNRVVVFSGHAHPGVFSDVIDEIRYINVRGMVLGTTDQIGYPQHWQNYGAPEGDANTWIGDPNLHRPVENSYCTVILDDGQGEESYMENSLSIIIDNYNLPDFHYWDYYNRPFLETQPMILTVTNSADYDTSGIVDMFDYGSIASEWAIEPNSAVLYGFIEEWLWIEPWTVVSN